MPRSNVNRIILTCILLCTCQLVSAQELSDQGDKVKQSSANLLKAARAIMKTAQYCAFITLDRDGQPQVRTMDPFDPDDNMVVWLGTHRGSRKVDQIRSNSRVSLYYEAPGGAGYVSISGQAYLIDDPIKKAQLWKEEWEQFYLDGKADYLLIQVRPDVLEIIDYSAGIVGDKDTMKVPSVKFASESNGH